MEKISLWEEISSKYILKEIFSYLKLTKSLEIVKINKKLRNIYDISLFHYQSYYFFTLFKNVKIETINDILESSYIDIFPEDVKYELIWRLIEKRKLFKNDDFYIIKPNKRNVLLTLKLMEKRKNKDLNYIFGGIIKDAVDNEYEYHKNVREIEKINENIMYNILFDTDFLRYELKEKYIKYVKYLNILEDYYNNENLYDISHFINLEYLFFMSKYEKHDELILKLSEHQIKNIKTIKLHESIKIRNTLKNIIITTNSKINKDELIFEKLEELHIKEKLLNKINFNPINLKKLNIVYDYRNNTYSIEYLQNSINNILLKYSSLTHLNILFFCIKDAFNFTYEFIPLVIKFLFDSIQNIENFSFKFYFLYQKNIHYDFEKIKELKIKNIRNKKSKFIIKGKNIPFEIFEQYFYDIEEIDLSYTYAKNQSKLFIEENNSISSITKIRINSSGLEDILYIPIKSFSSLKSLQLEIDNIHFTKNFPLFLKDSTINFDNLEYLEIHFNDKINILFENISHIPNLRVLSIINKNICNTVFPYHKEIIPKCMKFNKLHTLIIDESKNTKLEIINKYYSIYPELKKTKIKFCSLSKFIYNN